MLALTLLSDTLSKDSNLTTNAVQVMKGQSYNEKVDVFSFAIIIFELLSFRVAMAVIGDKRDLDYEAVHAHAEETANGYRLPLPVSWPQPIVSLIQDCWAQKSSKRPSFAAIERRLQEIQASGVIEEYLATNPKRVAEIRGNDDLSTGCIIS